MGVTYGAEAGAPWLSVSQSTGSLAGKSSAALTVSVNSNANTLSPGTYMGTITFASGGTSINRNATLVVTPVGACLDISGNWNASESGSASYSIVSPVETDSFTNRISGGGVVTISQTGCSIQYAPIGENGLIGANLTPSQLAMAMRTGTVSGNNVSVSAIVALVDTVAAGQQGLTIKNISDNLLTGTGQVVGSVITLSETGEFAASGTYSINGQSGSFTLTITTTSTATFNRGAGGQPTASSSVKLHVVPDPSPTGLADIRALLRNALTRALIFGGR